MMCYSGNLKTSVSIQTGNDYSNIVFQLEDDIENGKNHAFCFLVFCTLGITYLTLIEVV